MTYYRSTEELEKPVEPQQIDDGRNETDRRDFLKLAGFSLAAVTATACQRPIAGKAIPYLTAPEEIVPGKSYWMASTCHGCPSRCGVLVKCRDGRPIKVEGNPEHPLSRGGLCAVGQATVLGLYDSHRLAAPMLQGKPAQWTDVDRFIGEKLANAKRVRVVSSTLPSPTTQRVIAQFLSRFEDGKHIVYDVPSCSAIADAHEQTHGVRSIPHYRFDQADTILSIDADFLGTWISPVEFTKQWSARRGYHVQLEGRMSPTGAKADQRLRIDPRDTTRILAHLAGQPDVPSLPFKPEILDKIASRLKSGPSLVVCGSNRLEDQLLVNQINERLGNYGKTIDLAAPSNQRLGNDRDLALLREPMDALFVLQCNPTYDLADLDLSKVPLVVSFASHIDETAKLAHAIVPDHHPLESWDDSEPVAGLYTVTQPAVAPLRNTRAAIESFSLWSGKPARAYDLIKSQFAGDWEKTLHDGFAAIPRTARSATLRSFAPLRMTWEEKRGLALVLYPKVGMLDGRHAHNAWLHELPDPVTKVTWDNYACLSPATARKMNVTDGDIVRVGNVELPAFVQPGQHDNVVAIALGYGRLGTDRFERIGPKWLLQRTQLTKGSTIGKRVVHLPNEVTVTKTGRRTDLASTQIHNSMEGRNLVRELGAHEETHHAKNNGLWPVKAKGAQQWGLAIDLNRCTGCSGCVIACQVENNVPVVGKDEVVRQREMHWIRIDRYYEGEGDDTRTVHQPMMCAHCGNAPCETVCPVLATVHSSDGLNQQVYNRCVGTRYCANNCPYKARRFNWFDYPHEDRFANLALNPDVTIRTRGVMEKCSMCVQRIEEARIEAKQKGIAIPDGAIQTACQQSCPADAIVFGNLQDPKSRVAAAVHDPRYYTVLEELNVKPAVGYLKVLKRG